MTKHGTRLRPVAWGALLAATAIAAAGAAAATAGNGGRDTQQVAALKHQVARLKAQVVRLDAFSPAGVDRQLASTRKALDRYRDVAKAEADGYKAASPCESTPTDPEQTSYGGGMGIHYVNDAIMRSGALDPKQPPILVYAPQAGGSPKLIAAEYFKADADQNVKTDGDRPSLFGRAFDGPMQGHAPGMPIHYDLHVWLWQHNASGVFAPWNPAVACPA